MLLSVKALKGYKIEATDGDIGKIDSFLFDGTTWVIRYIVVDTGGWLMGKEVVLSPHVFEQPSRDNRVIPVRLTRQKVSDSPDIDTAKPVSRRHELEIYKYWGWSPYWLDGYGMYGTEGGIMTTPIDTGRTEETSENAKEENNLRSTREVIGYHIHAKDGLIGHVDDFIFDSDVWMIRYVTVDTRNWLPGKMVLVSTEWIKGINWDNMEVVVDLDKTQVKSCPAYDPAAPVNREYEVRLYDYYGRPKYWI